MADVFALTYEQAAVLFPEWSALLAPLLAEDGLYEPRDILIEHLRDQKKIWIAWNPDEKRLDAVFVTQIVQYPRKRVCGVPYIAGRNMAIWRDKFIEMSEAYAKAMGCQRMAGAEREGWVRAAGYRKRGVNLVKELT